MSRKFVSIVLPALNEEKYIVKAIETVTPHAADFDYEIIVADGGSTDRTQELVNQASRRNPRIRLVLNEKRLQSAGVNLAARLAHPDSTIIIRADCHAAYPAGFVIRCVARLAETAAQSVVVPMRTVGHGGFQRGVAAAQNSRLGNGGSAHRLALQSGLVEHGHHAAFDRAFFLSVGGYDERFSHNEDAELDCRIIQAGGKIWLDAENAVTYFPRSTLTALARQYFNHGRGRARTVRKHRTRMKLRQMAPVVILGGCVGGIMLSPLWWAYLLAPFSYAALCLGWGAIVALRTRDGAMLSMGPAAMAMHLAWATGFLREFLGRHLAPPPSQCEKLAPAVNQQLRGIK